MNGVGKQGRKQTCTKLNTQTTFVRVTNDLHTAKSKGLFSALVYLTYLQRWNSGSFPLSLKTFSLSFQDATFPFCFLLPCLLLLYCFPLNCSTSAIGLLFFFLYTHALGDLIQSHLFIYTTVGRVVSHSPKISTSEFLEPVNRLLYMVKRD